MTRVNQTIKVSGQPRKSVLKNSMIQASVKKRHFKVINMKQNQDLNVKEQKGKNTNPHLIQMQYVHKCVTLNLLAYHGIITMVIIVIIIQVLQQKLKVVKLAT